MVFVGLLCVSFNGAFFKLVSLNEAPFSTLLMQSVLCSYTIREVHIVFLKLPLFFIIRRNSNPNDGWQTKATYRNQFFRSHTQRLINILLTFIRRWNNFAFRFSCINAINCRTKYIAGKNRTNAVVVWVEHK